MTSERDNIVTSSVGETHAMRYKDYNASTIALEGVISPDSVHLFRISDAEKQEKIRSWVRNNNIVFVRDGHMVMDWLRHCGFADSINAYAAIDGWYKIHHALYCICIREIRRWASAIRLQRFFRWACWKARRPPLENVVAFQHTTLGDTLPGDVVCLIAARCFDVMP
jgi:hypothetical protein